MERPEVYTKEVQASLNQFLELLKQHPVIKDYQIIEAQIGAHEGLSAMVDDIKRLQKDAVQFAHYDKPVAEQEALRAANALQKEFDEHPLVVTFRERLIEANELVQYMTGKLEKSVNEDLDKRLDR